MAITTTPRSVSDATRFTQNTPHAPSKPSGPSRFTRPAGAASRPGASGPSGPSVPPPFGETAEQRVARLRAAHDAAKKSQVSKFDRFITRGRSFFDSAHKVTVMGLLSFTALAGLVTIYTAADMVVYNRKRKAEFLEAQSRMAADSLEAARLAYMTNKATDEQVALVEEALRRESGNHGPGIFSRPPSILGAPTPAAVETGGEATTERRPAEGEAEGGDNKGGFTSWLFSGLKKEEGAQTRREAGSQRSDEAQRQDGSGTRSGGTQTEQTSLRERAQGAFERERESQRSGGPLDRIGTDPPKTEPSQKKGWWPW